MPTPQTYKNHTRFDPAWHFFLAPMFLANLVVSIVQTVQHGSANPFLYGWWIAMSVAAFVALGKTRASPIVAQNRIIRLEEKLRYLQLLSPEEIVRADALTLRQVIALRFASDPELGPLIQRTLAENLTPKQIKQAIQTWRPDFVRV